MTLLSLLLFWLPVAGPLIAGAVGGSKAGTVRKALITAFAPAVLTALLVALILSVFDLPIIGALAGLGLGIAVLVQDVPLFVGAWLGAAFTSPR